MTRLMYDSTNIADIPQNAELVAYYIDGIYAVATATVRARFPNATLVPISAIGTDAGTVGDVEPGCMTPAQCVVWVKFRRLAQVDPTIYCNETNAWAMIRATFRAAGVAEPHYWCANYDNVAVLRPGQMARQYANPTLTGRHYDLSVVADYWPGVDGQSGGTMTPDVEAQLVANVAGIHAFLSGKYATLDAELVADIKLIPPPPPAVVDTAAIAAAVVAALPAPTTQTKPPAPPQAVWDWLSALRKWLGW